jgi:cholesterol transport system auxiliary component
MRRLFPTAIRLLALALTPMALGGCVSLFPKAKPVQLYSFGRSVPALPASAAGAPVSVLMGSTAFPPSAGGDRILTTTGSEAAYIAGARWLEPAAVMFDEDLLRAFDTPGGPRLVARGEPLTAPSSLRLDVRSFEVRYPGPQAVVVVRASLIRNSDRTLLGEKLFRAEVSASDNRQAAIVAAVDSAVAQVLAGVRDWTAATAPAH